MTYDMFGVPRYRVNLHTHTTVSDGRKTPEEAAKIYRDAGYDAIAITDHWAFGEEHKSLDGLLIISGAEYDIRVAKTKEGLFHIVGIGMKENPKIEISATAQEAIDKIKEVGGLAIIAHPAWSLNTPVQIMKLKGAEATEIYNSVSNIGMSRRPDSSVIVDMLGAQGVFYPLLASDDTHYYEADTTLSRIEVAASELSAKAIMEAIRRGDFYATQGPEIHLFREGDEMVVKCSPVNEIIFMSDVVWSQRAFVGEGLVEARYKIHPDETYVRAYVTDADGKQAWTNCIKL